MIWKPDKRLGLLVGGGIVLVISALIIYLGYTIVRLPFSPSMVLIGLFIMLLAYVWGAALYHLLDLLTLSYYLDRSQLAINSLYARTTIPLSSVTGVMEGSQAPAETNFRGVEWPGFIHGRYWLADSTQVGTHSTQPLASQLIVSTPRGTFGISPAEQGAFLAELRLMLSEGSTRVVTEERVRNPVTALPLWGDRWVWAAIALTLALNFALWAFMSFVYGGLPERLPIQYNPSGRVEVIGPKSSLLMIPLIGAMTWLVNSLLGMVLHASERFAAGLLQLANLGVQVMCWIAALSVIY
ncbi:MAG: DUF1648 domain-containing protein [Chloroflexi bacterium]|nr:DUF1648 domain-containing protein [Chloroflexota bacterium]